MKRTTKQNNGFTVLALDPSLTAFGWVVLQGMEILKSGCIKTSPSSKKTRIRKGDDRCRRITEMNAILLSLIKKYKVNYIVSEQPHGSQNAGSAVMVGISLALIQTLGDSLGIGVEWFSEADSKKCALGKQSASKGEMIEAMDRIYEVDWTDTKYIDEAVADSLGVHNVAMNESPVLKAMNLKNF